MIKLFMLISLIAWIPIKLSAQTALGIRIGATQSRINIANPTKSVETESGYGLSGSIIWGKKINQSIGLWIAPMFIEKKYSEKGVGITSRVITTYKNLHFQLPLFISYESKIGSFYPAIKGGIYGSYWLSGQNSGVIPDIFSTTGIIQPGGTTSEQVRLVAFKNKHTFSETDRRMEIGATITAEIGYRFNETYKIILDYDYAHSFTSMTKEHHTNNTKRYNVFSTLSLGLIYELEKRSK